MENSELEQLALSCLRDADVRKGVEIATRFKEVAGAIF